MLTFRPRRLGFLQEEPDSGDSEKSPRMLPLLEVRTKVGPLIFQSAVVLRRVRAFHNVYSFVSGVMRDRCQQAYISRTVSIPAL